MKSEVAPSLQAGSSVTCALHMGQVLSRSNQVATHSSQKMCLQCNIEGSFRASWQIGQRPPLVLMSSSVGHVPYLCWGKH